jgi:hypothetical protein
MTDYVTVKITISQEMVLLTLAIPRSNLFTTENKIKIELI